MRQHLKLLVTTYGSTEADRSFFVWLLVTITYLTNNSTSLLQPQESYKGNSQLMMRAHYLGRLACGGANNTDLDLTQQHRNHHRKATTPHNDILRRCNRS